MIKFFRHIRQKLLAEGKTTNYFKYAIGEIVPVVIGNFYLTKKDRILPSSEGTEGWVKP